MTMKVTVSGPILVNASKNTLNAVEKGLKEIGKIGREKVQQGTPVDTGFLRDNIKETKPTVSQTDAFVTISAGWTKKGGRDVVYAHFIETGQRWPGGKPTAYKGRKMFDKARIFLTQPAQQNKFTKIVVRDLGGR
tara:strand:- start:392 stop:796 length:405 start_codon:yes stop_codon:yes gene_type:complete